MAEILFEIDQVDKELTVMSNVSNGEKRKNKYMKVVNILLEERFKLMKERDEYGK